MAESVADPVRDLQGLTSAEVAERVAAGQTNANTDVKTKSVGQILREHAFTLFNFVNLALAVLVFVTGQYRNMTFMLVVLINLVVGVVQEIRAKSMVDQLSILTAKQVRVIRDGQEQEVSVDELVLDDLFMLAHGDQVPADAVVVKGGPLMDESLLTGESNHIEKRPGDELFSGSFVVAGAVTARVTRVGLDGYAAKINAEARYVKAVSSEILTTLNAIIGVSTFALVPLGLGLYLRTVFMDGTSVNDAILSTVAAVVGMIPQGLVLLTSSVLAIATTRLGRKMVLVQQQYCVETLARVDTLCLDKTGTITSGRMEVTGMRATGDVPYDDRKCKDMLLCATTVMSANGADANETAQAMLRYSEEMGFEPFPIVREIPFSSARKYSGCVTAEGRGIVVGVLLDFLDNDLLGFIPGHGGDPFQLLNLLSLQLLELLLLPGQIGEFVVQIILPVFQALGLAVQGILPLVQRFLPLLQMAFAALHLVAALPHLPLVFRFFPVTFGLGLQDFLLGFQHLFLFVILRFLHRVVIQTLGHFFRPADLFFRKILPIGIPAENTGHGGDHCNQNPDNRMQPLSLLPLRILFRFQTDRPVFAGKPAQRHDKKPRRIIHPAAERCFFSIREKHPAEPLFRQA